MVVIETSYTNLKNFIAAHDFVIYRLDDTYPTKVGTCLVLTNGALNNTRFGITPGSGGNNLPTESTFTTDFSHSTKVDTISAA